MLETSAGQCVTTYSAVITSREASEGESAVVAGLYRRCSVMVHGTCQCEHTFMASGHERSSSILSISVREEKGTPCAAKMASIVENPTSLAR
jgi:hypothetical protein